MLRRFNFMESDTFQRGPFDKLIVPRVVLVRHLGMAVVEFGIDYSVSFLAFFVAKVSSLRSFFR